MKRDYFRWYSPNLNRDMEFLVFGHSGASVLFFPTRAARFYDYEDWRVIEALRDKIENGWLQVYCVDSVDAESFYCFWAEPKGRIERHIQYENYIIKEVIPFVHKINPNSYMMSVGCSLGSYHAVNIALKYPKYFGKVVGMSGRYDLTTTMGTFPDLFDGYYDENIYFNSPNHFIPNLDDEYLLKDIQQLDITIVIGREDAFFQNNEYFSQVLWEKNIPHQFIVWDGEAHRARYWRKMVNLYL